MKLSDLISAEQVKAEALENPAVRAEWDRTAVAREVAHRVLRYRVEHDLSQTELGSRLGVPALRGQARAGGPGAVACHLRSTGPAAGSRVPHRRHADNRAPVRMRAASSHTATGTVTGQQRP